MRKIWMVLGGVIVAGVIGCEKPKAVPLVEPGALPEMKESPGPLASREEMRRVLEFYEVGRMPASPGNVRGEVLKSAMVAGGKVRYELVKLRFGEGEKLSMEVAVFLPAGEGRHAVFVLPGFGATPGGAGVMDAKSKVVKEVSPEDAAKSYELLLSRGYGLATFYYQQCAADVADDRGTGFLAAYPDYDWGALGAYAWGMSRVADYLETRGDVDGKGMIAVGHSRLGKACLIAGAFDERFAASVPAGSGAGGTGSWRVNGVKRGGKQGLEDVTERFPHWFVGRLKGFAGDVYKLPFDQSWLMALTAPRPLLSLDSTEDPWANGKAAVASYEEVLPVYREMGASENVGIHFRKGKHELNAEDWGVILDFCDKTVRHLASEKKFDESAGLMP